MHSLNISHFTLSYLFYTVQFFLPIMQAISLYINCVRLDVCYQCVKANDVDIRAILFINQCLVEYMFIEEIFIIQVFIIRALEVENK